MISSVGTLRDLGELLRFVSFYSTMMSSTQIFPSSSVLELVQMCCDAAPPP